MNKFWKWEVKNEADGAEERVLRLEGVIAEDSWFDDDVTPEAFRQELESGEGDITLVLSSPGGDCIAASRIYTMLRDYKGRVFVRVDGLAASAASVVAMAGDRVLMSPTALMMIHNPMTIAAGNADDMKAAIAILDEVKESIINAYEGKTGLARDAIARLMDKETWMDAHRAVELGFADGILFEDAADAADPDEEEEEEEEPEEETGGKPEEDPEDDPDEEPEEDPDEEKEPRDADEDEDEEPKDVSPLAAARIEGYRVAAMLCERSALAALTNRAAKKKPAPQPEPEPEPAPEPESAPEPGEKKSGPVTLASAEPETKSRKRRAHGAEKAPVGAACLAGAPGETEMAEQRELVANTFINMRMEGKAMSTLTNEARGAFFRSRMTGGELPAELKNALTFTKGANPGGPLLPVEISTQLITDIYGEDRFLQYLTHTQIKGLRLPKISATAGSDGVVMPDGSTGATAYTLADAVISFGRYPGREKILVPGPVARGTDTDLNAYITRRMTEQHRAFMRSRIFAHGSSGAAPSAGDLTHMSVYGTTSANGDMCITAVTYSCKETDTEAEGILNAIQADIAALPEGVRDEAKVVMPYADWAKLYKGLANGAVALFGEQAKQVFGFEVVICDSCTPANGYLVGDLSTIHVNYDDPLRLETDRDIDLDMDLTVIGYDYDIRLEDANRLRLAKVSPYSA